MKKALLLVAVALMSLCGTAQAQNKGDFIVGIDLGASPSLAKDVKVTNFGFGAKAMYNTSRIIRLGIGLEYWVPSNTSIESYHIGGNYIYNNEDFKSSIFDITANIDFLINFGSKFSLYPTIGLGYANLSKGLVEDENQGSRKSAFTAQVGIGAEYRITDHIGVDLKVRYEKFFVKSVNNVRLPITIGVQYKF